MGVKKIMSADSVDASLYFWIRNEMHNNRTHNDAVSFMNKEQFNMISKNSMCASQ